MNRTQNCREISERREVVASIINKMNEEGLWDSLKARDVPDEIITHVMAEIDLGKDPREIRRELGIKTQTSPEWQKISAAIKQGYRVNATTYFHRLIGRNEKISSKLYKLIDYWLDQDQEKLKELDENDKVHLESYVKSITPMIDAMNRLQQGTVKLGKDLGVFADPSSEHKGGSGGQTIVVKTNIMLPPAEELVKAKKKTVEGEVVGKKELP